MAGALINQVVEMRHDGDPRLEILEEFAVPLGKSGYKAVGHDVLIGVYDRSGKTSKGGVLYPDSYREDQYQGISGIILDLGGMCDPEHCPEILPWFGKKLEVGQWVTFNVRDGISMKIGNRTARLIEWKYIRGFISAPDTVM